MPYIKSHQSTVECVFCVAPSMEDSFENLVVHRGDLAFVIMNRYPYNNGHILVVPYQHCSNLEDLPEQAICEMMTLGLKAIRILRGLYHPQGFNMGINLGTAAGAGIAEHLHMHIIPRWGGDTNFMSVVGKTRVLPEELSETYYRICQAWKA